MSNTTYANIGKWIYAIAILAIGMVLIVTGAFPKGLIPVSPKATCYTILAFITGGTLVVSGLMLAVKTYASYGAYLALAIWTILLALVHLPILALHIYDGGAWTCTFEVLSLISGAQILAGNKLSLIGKYTFALSLFVFGIQHWMYAKYVASLVPAWLPAHLFFGYLVMVAFFAVALSIAINKLAQLACLLLALMFILWLPILHLPRAITTPSEPEWTSTFVALAMAGIALLVAGISSPSKPLQQENSDGDSPKTSGGFLSVFFD